MPSRHLQTFVRGATVVVAMGVTLGVFAFGQSTHDAAAAAPPSAAAAPTTTTVPPAPPTTVAPPATTAAPRPVATTPTTARPRSTTTTPVRPARVSQASPVPSGTPEERGQQALSLIHYPWEQLGYKLSFEPGRQTYLGMTESDTKTIHVYVRDNESMDTLARTIGHEMGHALDFSHITDAQRQQYIAIRGINSTLDTWYACNGCTDYTTAAGDWAETFQYWLLGPGQYWSQMGPPPSSDQLAQLSALFTM